jgi:hypothetical protein
VTTYSEAHRRARARLLPQAYNTDCPLCERIMLRGQELDLDHSVPYVINPGSAGDRIVHAQCNRSAGGRLGNERRKFRPSRQW